MFTITTLSLLQAAFPGKISLSSSDVARAANLKSGASLRSLRCKGSVDLQPTRPGGRNFDVREVAAWLDRRNQKKTKKNVGAPAKKERREAEQAGLTVPQLRAQKQGGATC